MDEQYICELDKRKLVKVGGNEAESFLQGILTCDLEKIPPSGAGFGGLLSPQGKILFDFFVIRESSGFLLDTNAEQVDELVRRLTFYRLRADVTLEVFDGKIRVFAIWGGEIPSLEEAIIVSDTRLKDMGWRIYTKSMPAGMKPASHAVYHAHRVKLGVPEGGTDYQYGNAFPHEALYDQTGGVDFSKGCYIGQEVVSRMHHRGTARKRIIQIGSEDMIPEPGTKITISGKIAGEITSSSGSMGLAILRLDHICQAISGGKAILADGVTLVVQIQSWATFDWPAIQQAE